VQVWELPFSCVCLLLFPKHVLLHTVCTCISTMYLNATYNSLSSSLCFSLSIFTFCTTHLLLSKFSFVNTLEMYSDLTWQCIYRLRYNTLHFTLHFTLQFILHYIFHDITFYMTLHLHYITSYMALHFKLYYILLHTFRIISLWQLSTICRFPYTRSRMARCRHRLI